MFAPGTKRRTTSAALYGVVASLLGLLLIAGCGGSGGGADNETSLTVPLEPPAITCPLCGREVENRSQVMRRPIAVKISNDPSARPQSGLDKACIVYEEITEGGVTRFMAIYLCQDADPIGPIRSARPVDIDLVYPYYAIFAHCGGANKTLRLIANSGILDLDEFAWEAAYWRSRDRYAPHNLYSSTERLRQAGESVYPFEEEAPPPFEFLDEEEADLMEEGRQEQLERRVSDAEGGSSPRSDAELETVLADSIEIPYTDVCAVGYSYDPVSKAYLRFVQNTPHVEMTTGQQLAADTVIVQYVTEGSSGIKDVKGAESPDLGVVGSGRAQVFMLGQVIDANWQKSSREEQTRYLDNSGREIAINPGSIWIQLVPASKQVVYQ